jgi:hypothetical protein
MQAKRHMTVLGVGDTSPPFVCTEICEAVKRNNTHFIEWKYGCRVGRYVYG